MTQENIYNKFSVSRIHSDWCCLVGQEHRLKDSEFRKEALCFARQIMRQALVELRQIVESLGKGGYSFCNSAVLEKPEVGMAEFLQECAEQGIYCPISLEAWLLEVGTIDLTGTNPGWPRSGRLEDDSSVGVAPLYADPLVVDLKIEHVQYMRSEFLSDHQATNERLVFEISPDYIHKANVSGGPPYEIAVNAPRLDNIVLNERHCVSFTSYIREAVSWSGMPGLNYVDQEELRLINVARRGPTL